VRITESSATFIEWIAHNKPTAIIITDTCLFEHTLTAQEAGNIKAVISRLQEYIFCGGKGIFTFGFVELYDRDGFLLALSGFWETFDKEWMFWGYEIRPVYSNPCLSLS
jgi:hypothetical protein